MKTRQLVIPPQLLERYLSLLGVGKRPPSVDALHEIVRAHLTRIPFENISKLYYRKHENLRGLPSFEHFLTGIERFNFGGTCYSNNYFLYRLLQSLGYEVKLCGADMSNPDVHLVSMVTVENREYLVDGGYAAPFLDPLPRDLTTDHVIVSGGDRYVLKPQDAYGRSHMELYRDGKRKHGYLAKPEPRQIHEFDQVIVDSFRDEATFMNALLLARFFADHSLVLRNLTLIESRGAVSKARTLASPGQLGRVVQESFAIPKELVDDVVAGLGQLGDPWS